MCYLFITFCASSKCVKASGTIVALMRLLCSRNRIKEITNYGLKLEAPRAYHVLQTRPDGLEVDMDNTLRQRYKQIALGLITKSN
jgi:hypothetical protein